jgi:outer membrane biosynthesis protein TonB
MSSEAVSPVASPLLAELFSRSTPRGAWTLLGWAVALGAHVAAAGFALTEQRPLPPAAPAQEPRPAERAPSPKAAAAPPEPARAGALLTAKADPVAPAAIDEPVDFTNDPSVLGFGAGVVAIGGKAKVGAANARLSVAAPSTGTVGVALRPAGETLTPASDLSRKPGLGESDPCRGYFPSSALDDVASAAVMLTIGKSGAVSNVRLLSESPPQQGFGAAARTCMAGKRFSPGLDRDGNPTATAIRVNIRFKR